MARLNGFARRCVAASCSVVLTGGALFVLFIVSAFPLQMRAEQGDAPGEPPSQPLLEGRRLFEEKGCAHCHGAWGGESEKQIGPNLGRNGSWNDVMQFAGSLWNHTPSMIEQMGERHIARPSLSPDEMGKLAAYLFSLNFLDEPGDVERGQQLFEQRACARCHQLAGRGGTLGPRLDEIKTHATSLFMAQALWNHGPEMTAKMAGLNLVRPRLEDNDVADLVAFIRSPERAAPPPEQLFAQIGNPRAGKLLFAEKGCIKCHAIAGTGGAVGPDLGTRRPRRHVAAMAGALWNHGAGMWAKMRELGVPFPKFTDREIADLLSYLHFAQYMGGRGDAAKGSQLFREKSCSQCHAAGSDGPKVGPDLAASNAIRSPFHWASAMWNHAPAMREKARATQIAWPRFQNDEMRDVVEFLRSRRARK